MKFLFNTIILFLILSSCSKKESDIATITPETITISGDLAKYMEVINGTYEIVDNGYTGKFAIKIKALKPYEETLDNVWIQLSATLSDTNGMPISGTGEFDSEYKSGDDILNLLKSGNRDAVIHFKSILGGYKAKDHASKSKKFRISSILKVKEVQTNSTNEATMKSSNSQNSNIAESKSTEEWDRVLDDYEEYVDKYLDFIKKANDGDMTALAEYPELMLKANTTFETLQKVQGDLTIEQAARMMKVQLKMAKAASEIKY